MMPAHLIVAGSSAGLVRAARRAAVV